jgi:hypothetical protein
MQDQERFQLIFARDMSENFIRREIDRIVQGKRVEEVSQLLPPSKKFTALVVYSPSNPRVLKSIKLLKKVFPLHLKVLLLTQPQFEELTTSPFGFSLNPETTVYKLGLPANPPHLQLTSLKDLFMLVMHPDLKAVGAGGRRVRFEIEGAIGRMLYGGKEKDYVVTSKGGEYGDGGRRKRRDLFG